MNQINIKCLITDVCNYKINNFIIKKIKKTIDKYKNKKKQFIKPKLLPHEIKFNSPVLLIK